MSDKLFIITRSDLPPGVRAAQSVHGALAFAFAHPVITGHWHAHSNNIVLVETTDEEALKKILGRALVEGIPCTAFTEPDLGNALTSIAIGPSGHRLVSHLPLTLREPKKAAA